MLLKVSSHLTLLGRIKAMDHFLFPESLSFLAEKILALPIIWAPTLTVAIALGTSNMKASTSLAYVTMSCLLLFSAPALL